MTERPGDRPLAYAPALDGLRAVAVLGVMLYHAAVPWLPGGFLGVDVFFVLSGFLITSLLLVEWKSDRRIDLVRFWRRRARRLLPALLLVIVVVCVAAWRLQPPEKLAGTRGDALAALFYVANWRPILLEQSYFDNYGDPPLFRHMWSLGIEEQFYLLFPLLVLGLLALLARRPALLGPGLAAVFALMAVGSAALMGLLFDPAVDASRVYYGTDTRAQELLVGAAAAVLVRLPPALLRGRRLPAAGWQMVAVVALGVVLAALLVGDDAAAWLYRGGFLGLSVATALLVVAVTQAPGSVVARLLALPPLVGIGLISYGLYLWHWPVDVLLNPLRTGLEGPSLLAVRFAVTFACALLSYLLLERPIRHGGLAALPVVPCRVVVGLSVPAVAVVVLGTTAAATAPPTVPDLGADRGPRVHSTPSPSTPASSAPSASSSPVEPAGPLRVMLVGDSVPFSLLEHFPGPQLDVEPVNGTKLGCGLLPALGYADGRPSGDPPPGCDVHAAGLGGVADSTEPDVGLVFVGIGEQFDRLVDDEVLEFGTPAYAAWLTTQLTDRVDVFRERGIPVLLADVPCHDVLDMGLSPEPAIINSSERIDWLNGVIGEFLAAQPDVARVRLHHKLCAHGYTEELDGVHLRTDGLHFTPEGAAYVWDWLVPQLRRTARDVS